MGTGYAILSVPKDGDMFSPLSHRLPWYQSEDEGFYACGVTCPFIAATTTLKVMLFLIVQKNIHFMLVGSVVLVDILLLNDRVDNDEAQQNSPSTDTMFMVSPSTVPNIMKCKHSLQNESDGNPRSYSTILVTTEEISVLVSTQEVLAALFLSNVNSQDDVQIDTGSLKIENIHESRESTLVNQEINNVSQIKQQDINNRALTESHSGYKFRRHTISNCKSSSPDYVPSDQQHGITVFNFNCVPTPSQQ
ncbi:hypothetical protein G6F57_002153 [Rhizopus arrhizus]|uniref:Uncharacterized protein n=1 Tax=Rhizopus oryzae TaxID=64495 RepID=A0A9P7BW03_RHIOR|nr:hypothetical protein G6F30_003230 [Rhizopus arrhizus]KAG1426894.1 hypothetical protein G6F58_001278 [Rhizopus delemar]KAG0986180.1 hypothetical protein G6F29_003460 [Rhizopus arrhizus]KAG0997478.1 hypothetical protein G6F28_002860 [Rhizopus arrhizus]KAG1011597.1 hypothetical protein G6F27_003595 [Rhizopus arrhizus]